MPDKIFDTKNVILLRIDEDDLNSFLVDMDIDDLGNPKYMLDELSEAIINTIPEYVFAHYEEFESNQNFWATKIREAAKSIYKIKEYDLMRRYYLDNDKSAKEEIMRQKDLNRGEFGELILHMLLRDFKGTVPLISKVYFKDSENVPAHGFDCVHISPNESILWLGESKFYGEGSQGIDKLIEDIAKHIKTDYMDTQFTIIKKNLENNNIPQRKEWIEILNSCTKLSERIKIINVPLLCIFPHDIYELYSDLNCKEAIDCHEINIRSLKKYFDENNKHPLKERLRIILMLFPVKNKKELAKRLHERLWHMQNI